MKTFVSFQWQGCVGVPLILVIIHKWWKHWYLQSISNSLTSSFYIIPTAGRTVVFASRATCILPTLTCAMREVTPTWTKTTCQTSEQSIKHQNFTCVFTDFTYYYNNNCPTVVSGERMYSFFQNQVSLTGETKQMQEIKLLWEMQVSFLS